MFHYKKGGVLRKTVCSVPWAEKALEEAKLLSRLHESAPRREGQANGRLSQLERAHPGQTGDTLISQVHNVRSCYPIKRSQIPWAFQNPVKKLVKP
jgi:hypothetical protein